MSCNFNFIADIYAVSDLCFALFLIKNPTSLTRKSFLTQWALETADNLLMGILTAVRIGEALKASDIEHISTLASCFAKSNSSDVDTLIVSLQTGCEDVDCRKFLLMATNLLHLSKNPWNTCYSSLDQCYRDDSHQDAALSILATSLGAS